ncbi:anti-sigma regulatory factor [Anaerolineales bacterium HSG6]|nr:anti-sigma regulatory factor [Anaerolineales bacterium HSG6]MDM8532318.1 anti-sigma regulatory factor [Anaerolineales bacterium HSG25]
MKQITIQIRRESDIILASQRGRKLADTLGFSNNDQVLVVLAISEIAHNILRYATKGEVTILSLVEADKTGLEIMAWDSGPGIHNIGQALQDGYSTGDGLGIGLPGVKRLMDEFEISSAVGKGTTIVIRKWLHSSFQN